MKDEELFKHMQVAHGMATWTPKLFEETYGPEEVRAIHDQDHSDPEEYGIAHSHKEESVEPK